MFERILVGYEDEHAEARDAVVLGRRLAEATGAHLVLATVVRGDGDTAERGEAILGSALPLLEGHDVTTRVLEGSPEEALHDFAERDGTDVIVLGHTHHGTLGRILHGGGIAERLLHGAPCSIAVAPRGFATKESGALEVIGIAFDGSPQSWAALGAGRTLAVATGASVRLLGVHALLTVPLAESEPTDSDFGGAANREVMEERFAQAMATLPAELRGGESLVGAADPADALVAEAQSGVDLLVMGSRGHGPVRQAVLGGTSAKVIREAWCPVLVVPRSDEGEDGSA